MPRQIAQNQWLPTIASIAIGVAVWFLFELGISKFGLTSSFSYWWAGYGIMLSAAALLGYLFGNRPWRWGIYIVLAHVTVASIRSTGDHNMLPLEMIFFAVLAVLYVLASYLGAWVSRKFRRQSLG